MRFKWRSHLAVTALAAFSLLPFAGCSSQQQQGEEEVQASEQGGDQQGGQESAETQGEAQEEGTGNEVATNAEGQSAGEEVVSNNTAANTAAGDGDLQEIISEMGNSEATATNTAAVPTNNVVTEESAAGAIPPVNEAQASATPAAATGAPAAVSGLPEMGSKMPYVVEAGDTLGKVATKIYGDQKKWRDISNLTGLSNPNHIFPGDVVYFSLDEASAQFAATYASLQRSKETVRDGDTLASIAKRVYGSSRSWRHIWRQNDNIDNPDKLTAGMTIYYINKDAIKTALNDFMNAKAKKLSTITKKLQNNGKLIGFHKTFAAHVALV